MRSGLLAGAVLCGTVALFWAGGPAYAQACAHDLCEEGIGLDEDCDPCVADICQVDSFCCDFDWDDTCVEQVLTVCGDTMCAAACEHTPCLTGGALDATCEPCVALICAQDPLCCSSQWDFACVTQVETLCNVDCLDGADKCMNAIPLSRRFLGRQRAAVFSSLVGLGSNGCTSAGDSCQSADIWYSYVKTAEDVIIGTCSTQRAFGIDTVLSIHSNCPGQPSTELTANDDWKFGVEPTACEGLDDPNLLDSGVSLSLSHLAEGEVAIIRVSHHAESTEGSFSLRVVPEPSATVLLVVGWAWLLVLQRRRVRRQYPSRQG